MSDILKTNVYCIIVTYNAMKWVDKCLSSLRQSSVPINAIIVDNCSKDETVSYIVENYPEVYVIQNNENRGFGQANNQGIEYAYRNGASHFFLLNQDAYIFSDTIEKLLLIQNTDTFSVVAPIHLNGDGTHIDHNYYIDSIISSHCNGLIDDSILGHLHNKYSVDKVCAAAWMISRCTIEKIGGFDPVFFHYGEDWNYLQRVKFHGGEVCITPYAFVMHDRISHGNINTYNAQKDLASLLVAYCNINNEDAKKFVVNKSLTRTFISCILHFKWKSAKDIIKAYIKLLENHKSIKYSKSCNVSIGHHWLNV